MSRSALPAVLPGQHGGGPHVGGGLGGQSHVLDSIPAAILVRTLPRAARVRRRTDYLRVQKQSARVAAPHFVFLLTPSPRSATAAGVDAPARPRLGIIASRQLGNAVVRARAKRLVRAAFREVWPSFPAGIDVVVLVRGEVSALRFADVLVEWRGVEAMIARRARAQLSPKTPPPRGGLPPGSSSLPP